jgi:hypothetical protein
VKRVAHCLGRDGHVSRFNATLRVLQKLHRQVPFATLFVPIFHLFDTSMSYTSLAVAKRPFENSGFGVSGRRTGLKEPVLAQNPEGLHLT